MDINENATRACLTKSETDGVKNQLRAYRDRIATMIETEKNKDARNVYMYTYNSLDAYIDSVLSEIDSMKCG